MLDDAAASHVVSILDPSSGGAAPTKLADDAEWFDISPNGHFIIRTTSQEWVAGEMDASLFVRTWSVRPVPGDITYATIAPEGIKIAWVTSDSGKSTLVVAEHNDEHPRILYCISTNGVVTMPSWSP